MTRKDSTDASTRLEFGLHVYVTRETTKPYMQLVNCKDSPKDNLTFINRFVVI